MAVMSGGDEWVVGYASDILIRLDRIADIGHGRKECLIIGKKRFCCIHILGWQVPRIFQ